MDTVVFTACGGMILLLALAIIGPILYLRNNI